MPPTGWWPLAKKRVLLLLRRTPFNSVMATEGLRQSVGLTMAENQVTVLLMGPAAWLATPVSPQTIGGGEVKKHLDMLARLKAQVLVDAQSLKAQGIDPARVLPGIRVIPREEALAQMATAEACIPF